MGLLTAWGEGSEPPVEKGKDPGAHGPWPGRGSVCFIWFGPRAAGHREWKGLVLSPRKAALAAALSGAAVASWAWGRFAEPRNSVTAGRAF